MITFGGNKMLEGSKSNLLEVSTIAAGTHMDSKKSITPQSKFITT